MPSQRTSTYDPKPSLQVLMLFMLSTLLAPMVMTGCAQSSPYKDENNALPIIATHIPTSTNEPTAERTTFTPKKVTHPTPTIAPTVTNPVSQIVYGASTIRPTQIPESKAAVTPTPQPAQLPQTIQVPIPTPARPAVSGYLLMVNGSYIPPNEVSIRIANGHVMVSPMVDEEGSYPIGTEVTLGYYPDRSSDVVFWTGVDSVIGSVATVSMKKDREVIATIGP